MCKQVEKTEINKFTFLIFAEFVGYESLFVEWAEKMCKGEKLEDYQITLIERDAYYIFNEMSKEFDTEDIKNWYKEFYDIILKDYDETIKKLTKKTEEVKN